jgi:hypothetical protein
MDHSQQVGGREKSHIFFVADHKLKAGWPLFSGESLFTG